MNTIAILILVLALCVLGALAVLSYGISWAERHFEEYQDPHVLAAWEVVTDDFNTVKDCMQSGRLISLDLVWSWGKFRWMFRFTYNPNYHVGYAPY